MDMQPMQNLTQQNLSGLSQLFSEHQASEDDCDNELMFRYCNGDFSAFEVLYHRHSRSLYRYVAWQTPRGDWVDEIVQDTWMRLHDARPNYRAQAGFKTFLYTIARHRMIDLLRKHRLVLESELGSMDEDSDSIFEKMLDQHAQAQNDESQNTLTEALHDAIRALPKEQREALIAQQFSGLSLEEIAQLTDTSIETVKSRLRYAMKKLRQMLIVNMPKAAA